MGVLLLHGFNGTPGELRSLADTLAAAGFTVEVPLLAGHGGTQEALAAVTWHDWVASAETALARLQQRCRRVLLVGFSMGGAISLTLAARHASLAGLATISMPTHLGTPLVHLLPLARRVVPYYYPLRRLNLQNPAVLERLRTFLPDLEVDPANAAQVAEVRRSVKVSLESVYQLVLLLRATRRLLPEVRVPTLLVQAADDEQSPRSSLSILAAALGSDEKEVVYFARGGHMLPVGPSQVQLAARVTAFAQRLAMPATGPKSWGG